MPEDLHIESTIIRPSDPEKVIMDKNVYKTETEWWAHKKIELLNIVVKTLQQKVKDGDHVRNIEKTRNEAMERFRVSNNSLVFALNELHKDFSALSAELEKKNKLLADTRKKLVEKENSITILQADNKKVKAALAKAKKNATEVSLDEILSELSRKDLLEISKISRYYQ